MIKKKALWKFEHATFLHKITVKKSLAQEVRQKSDILNHRSRPLQPLLCLQHIQLCHYATCQGSSYTKNAYSLFYHKLALMDFFGQNSIPNNFETLFDVMCIFGSIQPKSCRTVLHTVTLIPLCLIMLPSISHQYAQSIYEIVHSQSF